MILKKEEKMTKLLKMFNRFHIRKQCTNLQTVGLHEVDVYS
jgi:hypothetical protein